MVLEATNICTASVSHKPVFIELMIAEYQRDKLKYTTTIADIKITVIMLVDIDWVQRLVGY